MNPNALVIGIDASNLRQGGGRTHLRELLRAADPLSHGISRVVVWGAEDTLADLPAQAWLETIAVPALRLGPVRRLWWQWRVLGREVRAAGCDLLFAPGGTVSARFTPVVTMSRNMLPFDWTELRRYGLSRVGLRLLLLRFAQSRSLSRSTGVIFLSDYARREVQAVTGVVRRSTTIPHGVSRRLLDSPRVQRPARLGVDGDACRVIYVSIVDVYKHQWHVVEALASLRNEGYDVRLDLVGPKYGPAWTRCSAAIRRHDPRADWIQYHGDVPHDDLGALYSRSDLAVFASSCENMPNILLEKMASALPIACSNRGPMPDVLGDDTVLFDPENPADLVRVLRGFLESPEMRNGKSVANRTRAAEFTWDLCASLTLEFLRRCALSGHPSIPVPRFPAGPTQI